jgi:hypothetical protein
MRPLVAIELDEPSHDQPHRQARDAEVEQLLKLAGLPLVRLRTRYAYKTTELEAMLAPHLQPAPHRSTSEICP